MLNVDRFFAPRENRGNEMHATHVVSYDLLCQVRTAKYQNIVYTKLLYSDE